MNNLNTIKSSIQNKLNKINTEIITSRKNDPKVNDLKECFKIKNHSLYIVEIRKIIGY